MCWLKGEPKLSDVLADPVVQLMMRRDQVDPERLHAFLRRVSVTLGGAEPEGRLAQLARSAGSRAPMRAH